ncbi:MAG: hypothetical protein ACLU9S_12915 [Oscillospiraceae bacterium]
MPGFLAALIDAVGGVQGAQGNLLWIAAAVSDRGADGGVPLRQPAGGRRARRRRSSAASATCSLRTSSACTFAWHMKNQTGDTHPALHLGRGRRCATS